MKKIILIFLISNIFGQVNEDKLSPVVTYWKTLTQEEKEIFLFSYLTMVYETHNELKNSEGFGGIIEWYYDNRAELAYGVFDQLEVVRLSEIVKWINEFYSHGEYANRPFIEALEFAYRFAEAVGTNIWEKYENLQFDKIKPGRY